MKYVWKLLDDTCPCSPHHIIIRLITGREGRACRESKMRTEGVLMGRPKGEQPLGRPRSRREANINVDPKETGWGVDCYYEAENKGKQRDFVSRVTDIILHKMQGMYWGIPSFSASTLFIVVSQLVSYLIGYLHFIIWRGDSWMPLQAAGETVWCCLNGCIDGLVLSYWMYWRSGAVLMVVLSVWCCLNGCIDGLVLS
jgi:hypothetical protein